MSVFGWKYSVWLPWLLFLHLPHRWKRMRACSHQTPPENLPSHRFPWRFSELIVCRLVQLHVSSWNKGVWLARTCFLHGFLLLPHKVQSAVGLRGSGAQIPDSCVSTAADDQLLQVGRPAAERAARQAASRQASPENMAPAATQRGSEPTSSRRLRRSRRRGMRQKDTPCRCCRQQRQVVTQERSTSRRRLCWNRRRGMPQLHRQHRQQRQVGTRPCETTNTASIVASVVPTNDAYVAICTRCARAVCRCMGASRRTSRSAVVRFSCPVN